MPHQSPWKTPIPNCSIPSWIFLSPTTPLDNTRPLFIDTQSPETHSLSLAGFCLQAQRLALGLQNHGLQRGDRVLLFSGNTILYPVAFMGIIMAGGVFTGANPTFVSRELAYQLQDSGANFMLCNKQQLQTALKAANLAKLPNENVFYFDDNDTTLLNDKMEEGKGTFPQSWHSLLAPSSAAKNFHWDSLSHPGEPSQTTAILNYSSGTTGLPKGVQITHYNYVANGEQMKHLAEQDPTEAATRHETAYLCVLPMYHAMAQTHFCGIAPARRVRVYIMRKYLYEEMLRAISTFRVTDLTLVPAIVVRMAKDKRLRLRGEEGDLSSVKRIRSGGAPLSREVCRELEEGVWPSSLGVRVNVKQAWGMTEATCSVMGWDPRKRSDNRSVGQLVANCEGKVVDLENDMEVPPLTQGEIWVRGPNVMKGYWGKPSMTADTITSDGWLKSGDIGYVDADGFFYIVDRKKELIKVKGSQVAPAELERVLLEHPLVQDAAVIGVPRGEDEQPRGYIVLGTDNSTAHITQSLDDWLAERVAAYKRITGGYVFVNEIPKNPSGKILRKVLRELDRNNRDVVTLSKL